MAHVEDLERLAEACLATAKVVKTYLSTNGHAQPTFDQNGPAHFPAMSPEADHARAQLRTAAKTLYDLASGPDEPIGQQPYNMIHDLNAFRYALRYKIPQKLPLNESVSYSDLAVKIGTDERQLKKMVRQLVMSHVFCEPKPSFVSHTAASKLLLEEGPLAFNGFEVIDGAPVALAMVDAIDKWGHGSQEPNQAGPNFLYNSDKICFDLFQEHPDTMHRFSGLMKYCSTFPLWSISHAVAGYDWASLGKATVVDIGGNIGHCSVAFAEASPKAKFIVQDLPKVIMMAEDASTSVVPEALKDRVSFQCHSFFEEQPVVGADVYWMRMIMHDYSDKYCTKILKAIVPAMRANSRILVMDQVLLPHGELSPIYERITRTQDMMMMTLTNATERDYEEWESLCRAVDPRLKIRSVTTPTGSLMSIIELILTE